MEAKEGVDVGSSKAETSHSLPMAFAPPQGNRGLGVWFFFLLRGIENWEGEGIQQ